MDLGLTGKKALITGSTKGIGRAIAETLVAEGASVAICSRTEADVNAAVEAMSAGASGTVVGSVCDAADSDAVRAWVSSSAEALGGNAVDWIKGRSSLDEQYVWNVWRRYSCCKKRGIYLYSITYDD